MNVSWMRMMVLALAVGGSASAQWSAPVVTNVNIPTAIFTTSPFLSPDGIDLYMAVNLNGIGSAVFRSTRAGPYQTFSTPTIVAELVATPLEQQVSPSVRADNLEIFFASTRIGGYDIWRATRPTQAVTFSAPVLVPELSSRFVDMGPSISTDGLTIYFASNRLSNNTALDLFFATRPNVTSPFSTPVPVTELNTPENDTDPQVSADGLTIVWSSGRNIPNRLDLFQATRSSRSQPFSNVTRIAAVNSTSLEEAPCLSPRGDELFFNSSRGGVPGVSRTYVSRFTGLVSLGRVAPGSQTILTVSDPGSPGAPYVAAASFGTTPGIPVDTRVVPLNPDPLFANSVGGLAPIFNGFAGTLDADGTAGGSIAMPSNPAFVGTRFFCAFVVLDNAAPSGIKTISGVQAFSVVP